MDPSKEKELFFFFFFDWYCYLRNGLKPPLKYFGQQLCEYRRYRVLKMVRNCHRSVETIRNAVA